MWLVDVQIYNKLMAAITVNLLIARKDNSVEKIMINKTLNYETRRLVIEHFTRTFYWLLVRLFERLDKSLFLINEFSIALMIEIGRSLESRKQLQLQMPTEALLSVKTHEIKASPVFQLRPNNANLCLPTNITVTKIYRSNFHTLSRCF